jgi:hypothetical protein
VGSYVITTEAEEALAAATAETVVLLAGNTSSKMAIYRWRVGFDGTSSTAEPIVVSVKRGNSASQGTSTGATEEKLDPDDSASLSNGFHSFTVEPTYTGQPLDIVEVHPQGGWYEWVARDDADMLVLDDATNSFIGIEVTAPATVNCSASLWYRPKL